LRVVSSTAAPHSAPKKNSSALSAPTTTLKKSLTSQPQPRRPSGHRKNSAYKKKPHRRSKRSPNPKSRSQSITRNYIISQECPKCPPVVCQVCNLSLSPTPRHSPRKVGPKSLKPKPKPKPKLKSSKCSKCDQADSIFSTLKLESDALQLQNSILQKSQDASQLHARIDQIRLQEEIQKQDTAKKDAAAQLSLQTRLSNLEAQELSLQQTQESQATQQTQLLTAQQNLKSQQIKLKDSEIQNLAQISILQQKWAKFNLEKNDIFQAKIMLEAQESKGRALLEDNKREIEEERFRYEEEKLV
jgi:hypothetical protein